MHIFARRARFSAVLVVNLVLLSMATAAPAAAPRIWGFPQTSVTAGQSYSFRPIAWDWDRDSLTYSITNKPAWATFSTSTGRLQGVPTNANAGTYNNIVVSVSDGTSSAALRPFSIRVRSNSTTPTNQPPSISGSPATSVTAASAYSFQPAATDANNDPLTFSIANKPAWATFSTQNGRLSGTPASTNVGTTSNIVISVSDGKASASLPAFNLTVSSPSPTNSPPKISGTPATGVNVGAAYSFQPAASDPNNDALRFSISNKPAWAAFNTQNGQLSGTPTATNVGTTSNIVISVSDGKASASLAAFSIVVTQTQVSNGSATISWTAPTTNTNGSTLSNLAGYRIVYGTSSTALTRMVQIANPGTTTYVIENLTPATYYFAVKSYTSSGTESALSNIATKVVR